MLCKASTFVGRDKVGGDGSASDGWKIFGGGIKDFNAPALDNDPFVVWGRDILSESGFDYHTSGSFGSGLLFAWPTVQALQIAGALDGGLTRPNFLLATRMIQMTHPMYLPGIQFNMDGNRDAFFIEGSDLARWDAVSQGWAQEGGIVELSGESKPCAFDQATGVCG